MNNLLDIYVYSHRLILLEALVTEVSVVDRNRDEKLPRSGGYYMLSHDRTTKSSLLRLKELVEQGWREGLGNAVFWLWHSHEIPVNSQQLWLPAQYQACQTSPLVGKGYMKSHISQKNSWQVIVAGRAGVKFFSGVATGKLSIFQEITSHQWWCKQP